MSQPTLLVTGASGHLGQRVLELLLEAKAGTIVAATRSPEKLASFAEKGVIVREADFDDPSSLAAAFAGVDRLLLISTDKVGVPGERLTQHLNAVKAAAEAGVKHIVYTSLTNPGPDTPILLAPDHFGTENAISDTQMGYTFLRNNVYTEMLLGSLPLAVQLGALYSAVGNGKIGYVTREDCARAAAAALAAPFNGRRAMNITGPEAVSQADLAQIASTISGKDIPYVPLPLETVIGNMVAAGLPRPAAEVYASFDSAAAQGKLDEVSDAVEELTGQKPMSVADFVEANRQAFAPTAAH